MKIGPHLFDEQVVKTKPTAKFSMASILSHALGFILLSLVGVHGFLPLEVWASRVFFVSLVIWCVELIMLAAREHVTQETRKKVKSAKV